ncbi:MAG TPA: hypothetical protein VFN24_13625 [Microbacterium sp.]|nr:hypothetical protein [Microbacterium sp.]
MNRRILTWTFVAVAALTLAGCSAGSSTGSTTDPVASASQPAQPAETAATDQSVSDACLTMAGPLQEASNAMAKLADVATDPQSAVDAWTALVDAYQAVSDTVANPEVKAAAAAAKDDLGAVRDAIAKVFIDKDAAAVTELTTATTDMQTSLTALNELCVG